MSVNVNLGLWVKTYREVEVLSHSFLILGVQARTQEGGGGGAARLQPPSANRDFRKTQSFADTISNVYAMYPLVEIGH